MSDNPQDVNPADPSGDGGSGEPIAPGVSRKERPQKAGQQPTFDDVMRAASAPPPVRNAVVVKRAQPIAPAAKAQPSFEEIMAGVTVSPEQAQAAANMPVDYIALGPIFSTATKANPDPVVGLDGLRRVRDLIGRIPLVAIGGITTQNAAKVISAGADAIAVISALLTDPRWIQERTMELQTRL